MLRASAPRKYHGASTTHRSVKKKRKRHKHKDPDYIDFSFLPRIIHNKPERKQSISVPPPKVAIRQRMPVMPILDKLKLYEELKEEKKLDGSMEGQLSLVGLDAKLEKAVNYRNLNKINDRNGFYAIESSPVTAMLTSMTQSRLKPESVGLVKHKGHELVVDASMYSMGDNYIAALSSGLTHMPLQKINVNNNRISDSGAKTLLQGLHPDFILEIDLSNNLVGLHCILQLCAMVTNPEATLCILKLEGNKLGDTLSKALCEALLENTSLIELNLARNSIGEIGSIAISKLIEASDSLLKLDLHWNKIRAEGAKQIATALRYNTQLRVLDISWNALSSPMNDSCAALLGAALAAHTKLFHVDFSHNRFKLADSVLIAKGSLENHSIMGLHMEGNDSDVDPVGFINLSGAKNPGKAHIFTRIMTSSKVRDSSVWREADHCWICERWKEVEFEWDPVTSGEAAEPVYLHLSFDDWQPDMMEKQADGTFRLVRMCPPISFNYFYTHNTEVAVALNIPTERLEASVTRSYMLNGVDVSTIETDVAHSYTNSKADSLLDINSFIMAIPRLRRLFKPPSVKAEWGIPISLFKDYKFDNDKLFNQCFEYDWENSRIPRLVKDPTELAQVKEFLRKNYKWIRETYKHYSSLGSQGGVWSIGQNALTDFCTTCPSFIDGTSVKLSDIDFNMKAALYSEIKNNPRKPPNALIRFQFMEIFVRLALDKYYKTNAVETQSDAVRKCFTENLLPSMKNYDCNKFRWERYINEQVDLVLKGYLPIIKWVYSKFSKRNVKPGMKPFMSLEEFQDICATAELLNDEFTAREIDFAYNLSMMTQVAELDSDRHFQMSIVEFYEALGRVAEMAKHPEPVTGRVESNAHLSFYLENIMPRLLKICPKTMQDNFDFPRSSPYFKEGKRK